MMELSAMMLVLDCSVVAASRVDIWKAERRPQYKLLEVFGQVGISFVLFTGCMIKRRWNDGSNRCSLGSSANEKIHQPEEAWKSGER